MEKPAQRMSIRDEQKLLTRERFIDAAIEVFEEVGYRPATVDQITARAGANRATFYLHFKDKVEVAAAIARRASRDSLKDYEELGALENPSVEELRAWMEKRMVYSAEHPLVGQMLNDAINSDPKFAQEYYNWLARLADKTLSKTIARHPAERRELIRSKIMLLLVMMNSFTSHTIAEGATFHGEDPLLAMAEIFRNELYPSAIEVKKKRASRAAA